MSYRTVEVEISNGRILSRDSEELPQNASALLTILQPVGKDLERPAGLAKGAFTVPDEFNSPLEKEVLREFEEG